MIQLLDFIQKQDILGIIVCNLIDPSSEFFRIYFFISVFILNPDRFPGSISLQHVQILINIKSKADDMFFRKAVILQASVEKCIHKIGLACPACSGNDFDQTVLSPLQQSLYIKIS